VAVVVASTEVPPDEEIGALVAARAGGRAVKGVVAAAPGAVVAVDRIAEVIGLPGNDVRRSAARADIRVQRRLLGSAGFAVGHPAGTPRLQASLTRVHAFTFDGATAVHDVWRRHRAVSGGDAAEVWIHPAGSDPIGLWAPFCAAVAAALGVRWGPTQLDVSGPPNAPRLVDVVTRLPEPGVLRLWPRQGDEAHEATVIAATGATPRFDVVPPTRAFLIHRPI
jgi:hypothetical protein